VTAVAHLEEAGAPSPARWSETTSTLRPHAAVAPCDKASLRSRYSHKSRNSQNARDSAPFLDARRLRSTLKPDLPLPLLSTLCSSSRCKRPRPKSVAPSGLRRISLRGASIRRGLLIRAAGLAEPKDHALDAGAGALNATRYLCRPGFKHVTALDSSPVSQTVAAELPREQVCFVLSRFEDFDYPDRAYEFVNAEFSLPFISAAAFPSVFTKLMASVKIGGLFTGQLFGPNDSWNLPESGMNFHSRSDVERLLRGCTVLELTEEDRPGKTKLGEDKHWHIFHITARRMV